MSAISLDLLCCKLRGGRIIWFWTKFWTKYHSSAQWMEFWIFIIRAAYIHMSIFDPSVYWTCLFKLTSNSHRSIPEMLFCFAGPGILQNFSFVQRKVLEYFNWTDNVKQIPELEAEIKYIANHTRNPLYLHRSKRNMEQQNTKN